MVRKTSTNIEIRSCLASAKTNDRRGRQQYNYQYSLNKAKGWNFRKYLESKKEKNTTSSVNVEESDLEDVTHVIYVQTSYDDDSNTLSVNVWTVNSTLVISAFQFDFNGEFPENNTIETGAEKTSNPFHFFNLVKNLENAASRTTPGCSVVNGYNIVEDTELKSSINGDMPSGSLVLKIQNASDIDLKKVVLTDTDCNSYTLNLPVSNDVELTTSESRAISQDLFNLVENFNGNDSDLIYFIANDPLYGNAFIVDHFLIYDPDAGYLGQDSVVIGITDNETQTTLSSIINIIVG